jgi:hypothetical protein
MKKSSIARSIEALHEMPSPTSLPAARARPCSKCTALDDYKLRGQPARALIDAASGIPTNNGWPELARIQASLSDDSLRI